MLAPVEIEGLGMLARMVAVVIGVAAGGAAHAQALAGAQQWLCVTDQATGFNYYPDSKSWRSTAYKPDDLKYIIRRVKPDEATPRPAKWVLVPFGDKPMMDICERDFVGTILVCNDLTNSLVFNAYNLRFTRTRMGEYYWTFNDNSTVTPGSPAVEIGRCTPF